MRWGLLVSCSLGVLAVAGESAAQQSTESYTYDALSRLIVVDVQGGQNDQDVRSVCYDKSDNRTSYTARSDGTSASCVDTGEGTGGGGTPPPPPPPPPGNNPPQTLPNYVDGACYKVVTVNLTANDSDPEGNLPLTLTAIVRNSGSATASIVSASSARVKFGPQSDSSTFTYTVKDSLGAAATGTLGASSWPTGCGIIEP